MATKEGRRPSREIGAAGNASKPISCCAAYFDIVAFSKSPQRSAYDLCKTLHWAVREATIGSGMTSRNCRVFPLGDSVCLVMFGSDAPLMTLLAVIAVQRALKRDSPPILLRTAVHCGQGAILDGSEIDGVAGSCITVAQRVMDYGDSGHILATEDFIRRLPAHLLAVKLLDVGRVSIKHRVIQRLFNCYGTDFGNSALPRRLQLDLFEEPPLILLKMLSRISQQLDSKFSETEKGLPHFRSSVLLFNEDRSVPRFMASPYIAEQSKIWGPSEIVFPATKGLMAKIWRGAKTSNTRKCFSVSLPDPKSERASYMRCWRKIGVSPSVVRLSRRPGRFYLYIPFWNAVGSKPRGIFCADSLVPLDDAEAITGIVRVVMDRIDSVEACFR